MSSNQSVRLKKPAKPPTYHESKLQSSIVNFFRSIGLDTEAILYAVPNGEKRDPVTAAILKAQGVLAGVADLTLVVPGATWYIELKNPAFKPPLERYLSDDQETFRDRVVSLGHNYRICNSIEGFLEVLHEAGVAKRVRISPVGVPFVSVNTPARYIPNFERSPADRS